MTIKNIHERFLQCNNLCTDSRKVIKNSMFFALKGEHFNGNIYAKKAIELGAKFAIVDDKEYANTSNTILVNNVLETLQELATYHRNYLNIPIIALTGSNGKTTTKELINIVLSKKYKTTATYGNLNNHIGVPLTLLSMDKSTEIGIVEMGANHQKEIELLCNIAQPDFGYITNFGKAHLEGFGGVEGVIKGKSEMYDYLINNKKHIFVNTNDPIQVEKTKKANLITFGTNKTDLVNIEFVNANPFVITKHNNILINSLLIGDYNFNNIAAAITIGTHFKVDNLNIKQAIESYKPTNNRSQIIEKGTNKIILDAYNANPSSMHAALLNFQKLEKNKIAFLGDMFELGEASKKEHQAIVELTKQLNLNEIIFIGEHFYDCNIEDTKSKKYKTFNHFKDTYSTSNITNSNIIIKGSRGMALERILDIL